MLSFLALVYDETNIAQSHFFRLLAHKISSDNQGWRTGVDISGLKVYYKDTRSDESCLLQGQSGIVLGTLFERNQTSINNYPVLQPHQSASIIASGGRQLIDTHWGSYVAFLCDTQTGQKWILRSPAGHLPCYRTTSDGVHIYFSRDFADADPKRREVDWSYIAAVMTMPRESESTGLKGVSKVHPGECVEHQRSRVTTQMYWNPAEIARTNVIENPSAAAQELRRSTKNCVHTWAARHSSILVSLSGGLDSSIVLGCLQDAPARPSIKCLTHYSSGHRSDERYFARLAAAHANCELIEWPRNSHIDLRDMLSIARFPEPLAYFRRVEMSRVEAQFAQESNATALFSGSGGDQLFWQSHARLAVADAVHRHRLKNLFGVAYNAAQLERLSFWKVLGEALHTGLVSRPWEPLQETRSYRTLFMEEKVRASQHEKTSLPVWLQNRSCIPPGKRRHILSLTARSYYDSLGQPGDPEIIAPLMSQPIVETCLRIPTYLSIMGGVYRAIARQAFTPDVPSEILQRRSKGGMEEHVLAIWIRNLSFAREMLLDGALVQAGLLDRAKLAEALADRPSGVVKDLAELFWYLCIEVWIRRMTAPLQRKVA